MVVGDLIWKDPPHQLYNGLKVKGDELICKTSPQLDNGTWVTIEWIKLQLNKITAHR